MAPNRRDGGALATRPTGRGAAPVFGLALLLAFVIVASVGVLVIGGQALTEVEREAELERVEGAFVNLGQLADATSRDDGTERRVSLDVGEHGRVQTTQSAEFRIDADAVFDDRLTVGTIEYVSDDGTTIAYESGAVFRDDGEETRLVSAPEIAYDFDAESLSIPVYALTAGSTLGSSGDVRLDARPETSVTEALRADDATVTLTVESAYYEGWETYFEREAGGAVVQESESIDGDRGYVTVSFGYAGADDAFDVGVSHASATHPDDENAGGGEHAEYFGSADRVYLPELDDVVADLVELARTHDAHDELDIDRNLSDATLDDPERLTAGTYYVDEIEAGDAHEFDLGTGNATLVVAGDVTVGDSITATNVTEDHALSIYAGGDRLAFDGGTICVEDCDGAAPASHLQFYGPSGMGVDMGPGSSGHFEGLLYVAATEDRGWWDGETGLGECDDQQVRMQAKGSEETSFVGSVVAYSACAQAIDEFQYDDRVADREVDVYPDPVALPPPITHVSVATHEVDVRDR